MRDDGFLYGTAPYGGQGGRGVVFRLRRDGSGFQVLHNFHTEDNTSASIFRGAYPVNADGDVPDTGLTEGRDGFLYGIAEGGRGERRRGGVPAAPGRLGLPRRPRLPRPALPGQAPGERGPAGPQMSRRRQGPLGGFADFRRSV